ncbi:hypothetical protein [Polaribacter gochangensis]|uniref:hypothetical protein n=1 Tax=Polaribacter gochangensis TaxID=3252903 RepID=UPI003904CEBA
MKKHILSLLLLTFIFNSCIAFVNDFVLEDTSFNFDLTNYTETTWNEGTLYVGAKNLQGDFIATDSVKYIPIPSNISPVDSYTEDNYSSNGKHQGYHYYKINNLQYVTIPYPIISYGSLHIDKDKLTAISSTFGFVFKLSDGQEAYLEAYDINKGIDKSRLYINFYIKSTGITGKIRNNNNNDDDY